MCNFLFKETFLNKGGWDYWSQQEGCWTGSWSGGEMFCLFTISGSSSLLGGVGVVECKQK